MECLDRLLSRNFRLQFLEPVQYNTKLRALNAIGVSNHQEFLAVTSCVETLVAPASDQGSILEQHFGFAKTEVVSCLDPHSCHLWAIHIEEFVSSPDRPTASVSRDPNFATRPRKRLHINFRTSGFV
jgi:hypothetical protein